MWLTPQAAEATLRYVRIGREGVDCLIHTAVAMPYRSKEVHQTPVIPATLP